jgi:DNA-binding beta-propeller fold protein YncE
MDHRTYRQGCLLAIGTVALTVTLCLSDLASAQYVFESAHTDNGRHAVLVARDADLRDADGADMVVRDAVAGRAGMSGAVAEDFVSDDVGRQRSFVIEGFPLTASRSVDLEVVPFRVVTLSTRFVIGRIGQPDKPIQPGLDRVRLYRGQVAGLPGSRVFLAVSDGGSLASIDLGVGGGQYRYSSRSYKPNEMVLIDEATVSGLPPSIPICHVVNESGESDPVLPGVVGGSTSNPLFAQKVIEIAIETDHEFFDLFGNAEDASAYVVMLMGAVSDVFLHDVNARLELSFVRLWDSPDDLFNESDPLSPFRDYWNANMGDVPRDVAQFLSGRRDLPYGGIAWLNALCGSLGYSVVGYVQGFSTQAWQPHVWNYDVRVSAHELGHNCAARHTHDYQIDNCNNLFGESRRGTIMSYCGQTRNGGNANQDIRFHAFVQTVIEGFLGQSSCVATDCNQNGQPDETDVALGESPDVNANGIPDECEDCNANGQLDTDDILSLVSQDVNGNSLPDECEDDCNGNDQPDSFDIELNESLDLYGDNVPDECQVDCDGDSVGDYNQILGDMGLDIDRDARLDGCQDCNGDGVADFVELDGAHDFWIASDGLPEMGQFHAGSGVRVRTSATGFIAGAQDVLIMPDGRVLVTSGPDNRIAAFDRQTGDYVGDLVPEDAGFLSFPTGMALLDDQTLLVCSRDDDAVARVDLNSGENMGWFVSPGSGGLDDPFGLVVGPDGQLYVNHRQREVLRFSGSDGQFVDTFVPAAGNGGLSSPHGMTFAPNGNLLVASFGNDVILEYDGRTGAFIGQFNHNGNGAALTLDRPWGIRVGPNGNVFVSRSGASPAASDESDSHDLDHLHLNTTRIFEFDSRSGNFVRSVVIGNDSLLTFPAAFDFVPGWSQDCNLNSIPDACDVADGLLTDDDGNGIADECEVDCNQNSRWDRLDIIPYGSSLDCNANLIPDECELASGSATDCDGDGRINACDEDCNDNHVPDSCEADCNDNGTPDDCDIVAGTSLDLDGDGRPDECLRLGDLDQDGDVDLIDFGEWFDCQASGGSAALGDACGLADLDVNDSVDVLDFGIFQSSFTGDCAFEIVASPEDLTACLGSSVTFTAEVVSETVAYQWEFNGATIPGATGPTLAIEFNSSNQAGTYSVFATNSCFTFAAGSADLQAIPSPKIAIQPGVTDACPGATVEIESDVFGVGPFHYEWSQSGVGAVGGDDPSLILENVGESDVGVYRCAVTDGCGAMSSSGSAVLNIVPPLVMLIHPQDASVCLGEFVVLVSNASNPSSYQWFKDNQPVPGATDSILTISNAIPSDSGEYFVMSTDACSDVTSLVAVVSVEICQTGP